MRIVKPIIFIFFLLITTSLFANTNNRSNNMSSILSNKPYITVSMNIASCAYTVLINDVPIFNDDRGIPFEMALPVNEWLKSGENTLSVKLLPAEGANQLTKMGQNCEANVSLEVKQSDSEESPEKITTIRYHSSPENLAATEANVSGSSPAGHFSSKDNFKESNSGDVEAGSVAIKAIKGKQGDGVEISRTISMPLPIPRWKWLDGETLVNNDATKESLLKVYEQLWNAIHDHKLDSIKSMFTLKQKEYSQAFFTNGEQFDQFSALKADSNNPKLELVKIIPKYVYLDIFGDGKLAKLVTWDGGSIIFFNYKNADNSVSYDFVFSKINGKWVLVR